MLQDLRKPITDYRLSIPPLKLKTPFPLPTPHFLLPTPLFLKVILHSTQASERLNGILGFNG